MAGRAGRTYKRDGRGRFASTGGGGSKKPKARMVSKGTNRLTRDNSGRITSVGGDGATVRGGRLKTASGKQRGTQVARLQGAGPKGATIAKGGRGVSGAVARSLAAVRKGKKGQAQVKAANAIKPSTLLAAEKAYGEIKAQKSKFRSDKKVREEMMRRGFLKGNDPQGDLMRIARKYRMRRGGSY